MRHILERLEQMAIDLNPVTQVVQTLSASIASLTELAAAKIAEAEKASADTAAQVAADEASAMTALGQLSDHLSALVTQIDTFVAAHAATPQSADPANPA